MHTNQPTQAVITDFGSIKQISGPPGWQLTVEQSVDMKNRVSKSFQSLDGVSITVHNRGQKVADEHADKLDALLKTKGVDSELTAAEIKSLSHVLGYNTVGDNQHTNDAPKGTHEFATFRMDSARVANVNGRALLKVEGIFQASDGSINNAYVGYYVPNPVSKGEIDEVFLVGKDPARVTAQKQALDAAMKSIIWQ